MLPYKAAFRTRVCVSTDLMNKKFGQLMFSKKLTNKYHSSARIVLKKKIPVVEDFRWTGIVVRSQLLIVCNVV